MANRWKGEVALMVNGTRRNMKLTLGALAELEAALDTGSFIELVERFESHEFDTRDVLALIVAGLRGGGWDIESEDLISADIEGGPIVAARRAAELLTLAFQLPEEAD